MRPHSTKPTKASRQFFKFLPLLFLLTSCAGFTERISGLFEETPLETQHEPTEREKQLMQAQELDQAGQTEQAFNLYAKITRDSDRDYDPVYDQSLWRMSQIYEQQDESEKAILALDELSKRPALSLPLLKIKFALLKNHERVSNYFEADAITKQIDEAYRTGALSLGLMAQYLTETSSLNYDHHIRDELSYVGKVQKYYLFVMESDLSPENSRLTDLLIKDYDGFFASLQKDTVSIDFKKQLAIALLDQLRHFDQYKLIDPDSNPQTLRKFAAYSEAKQKYLIDLLAKESFN